jgi:hypothetical protein
VVSGSPFATHNYTVNVGSGYSVVQNPAAPLADIPNGIFSENLALRDAETHRRITGGNRPTAPVASVVKGGAC